jgi:hypothetical protein
MSKKAAVLFVLAMLPALAVLAAQDEPTVPGEATPAVVQAELGASCSGVEMSAEAPVQFWNCSSAPFCFIFPGEPDSCPAVCGNPYATCVQSGPCKNRCFCGE